MKNTVNIRIKTDAHRRLKIMAAEKGVSLTDLITQFSEYVSTSSNGYQGYKEGGFTITR